MPTARSTAPAELDAWLGTGGDADEPVDEPVLLLEAESRAVAAGSTAVVSFTVPAERARRRRRRGRARPRRRDRRRRHARRVGRRGLRHLDGARVGSDLPRARVPADRARRVGGHLHGRAARGVDRPARPPRSTARCGRRQAGRGRHRPAHHRLDPRAGLGRARLGHAVAGQARRPHERDLPARIRRRRCRTAGATRTARAADADDLLRRARPRRVHRHRAPARRPGRDADPHAHHRPHRRGDARPDRPRRPHGELPTTEAILAWPYTRTDIAWPADDTIASRRPRLPRRGRTHHRDRRSRQCHASRRQARCRVGDRGVHRCRRRRGPHDVPARRVGCVDRDRMALRRRAPARRARHRRRIRSPRHDARDVRSRRVRERRSGRRHDRRGHGQPVGRPGGPLRRDRGAACRPRARR